MNRSRWLSCVLLGLLGSAVVTSCADRPATSVTLAIASEVTVPQEVDRISLEVRHGARLSFARSYTVDPVSRQANLPGSIVFTRHDDDDAGPLRVVLRADLAGEQVLLRSAAVPFVTEKNKLLRMTLRYSCVDFPDTCKEGESCRGGVCSPEGIDPASLPEVTDEALVFPRKSQGSCFDDTDGQCAARRGPLPDEEAFLASSDCSFEAASVPGFQRDRLNVFVLWDRQLDQAHPVVLDQDPNEGWTYASPGSTRVSLAPGLCLQLKQQQIRRVLVNSVCATKSPSVPICRPDVDPQGPSPTFFESECHRCAYSPPACEAEFKAASEAASSREMFARAAACPYDGHYDSVEECEGVRGCFVRALQPLLACASPECQQTYAAARAWEACVASQPPPAGRCAACGEQSENVKVCDAP